MSGRTQVRAIQTSAIISLICLILLNLFTLHYIINMNHTHHDELRAVRPESSFRVKTTQSSIKQDMKIPRIVHLSWKDDKIPGDTVEWVKQWPKTNPNYQVWFWTDDSAKKFVTAKFPHLLDVFNRYRPGIFRADAMRYIILYEYGGIWADLDVEPLKSLDPIREQYPSILSQESEVHARSGWHVPVMICNAFMATRKHHPFFKFIIDMLEVNQKDNHPVAATGPVMVTRMHQAYEPLYEAVGNNLPWNKVHIGTVNMFMPTTDVLALNNLKNKCKDKIRNADVADLCDKYLSPSFKNGPTTESFTDHHWWHSWLGRKKYRTFHPIKTVLPDVILPDKDGKF